MPSGILFLIFYLLLENNWETKMHLRKYSFQMLLHCARLYYLYFPHQLVHQIPDHYVLFLLKKMEFSPFLPAAVFVACPVGLGKVSIIECFH